MHLCHLLQCLLNMKKILFLSLLLFLTASCDKLKDEQILTTKSESLSSEQIAIQKLEDLNSSWPKDLQIQFTPLKIIVYKKTDKYISTKIKEINNHLTNE